MRRSFTIFMIAAIVVLSAISMALNFRFGYEIGRHTSMFPWFNDGWIFGIGSVALDVIKIGLPTVAMAALLAKGHNFLLRGIVALAAVAVWLAITPYSLSSAVGSALLSRSDAVGARQNEMAGNKALKVELDRLLAKKPWTAELEPYRGKSAAAMSAEIERQKLDPIWTRSENCTDVTRSDSRRFCQTYQAMLAAKAIASEEARDNARIAELRGQLGTASNVTEADPFAQPVSHWTGYDQDAIRFAWGILFAMLLEFLPSIGPALFFTAARLRTVTAQAAEPVSSRAVKNAYEPMTNGSRAVSEPFTGHEIEAQDEDTAHEKGIAANIVPFTAQEADDDLSEKEVEKVIRMAVAAQGDPAKFSKSELVRELKDICKTHDVPLPNSRTVGRVLSQMGFTSDRLRAYTLTPARERGARLADAA